MNEDENYSSGMAAGREETTVSLLAFMQAVYDDDHIVFLNAIGYASEEDREVLVPLARAILTASDSLGWTAENIERALQAGG